MSTDDLRALKDALELKQKELDFLMTIDKIRDSAADPDGMLSDIIDLLGKGFDADACLLFLLSHEAGKAGVAASYWKNQELDLLAPHLSGVLAQRAAQLEEIDQWDRSHLLTMIPASNLPQPFFLAAIPVIMGQDERLGALLVARIESAFSPEELQLLRTVEEQIDSAIIQGYVQRRHQRTRAEIRMRQEELHLLDAIDRIRDTLAEPSAMLSAIVNLLVNRFSADLGLLFLINRETKEVELRALSDHSGEFGQLAGSISRELAWKATQLDEIAMWDGTELLIDDSPVTSPEQIHLAAVPIIMGADERLGAMLLFRSQETFTPDDLQLLARAEDQIDSAIIQGYNEYRHQQLAKELETIYRIDLIRDQDLQFGEMLDAVLQEVLAAIEAEMGFVMLYDQAERQLEARAATPDDLFQMSSYYEFITEAANESLNEASLICHNRIGEEAFSLMCLPLILNQRIIGVLGAISRQRQQGFTDSDRRLLQAIGSQVDTAIFERSEKRKLRQVLGRSVDPHVMERLLANPDTDILKGERLELTVLYADIRDSTRLAEQTHPELLVEFINSYLGEMTAVILSHEGTLDKFVGDEVMALFGAPIPHQNHALRAVRAGLSMQAAHADLMKAWQERGLDAAPIGIGIATGELIVGEMGCAQRTDYTVLGRAANLGARICEIAKANQVLVSQRTYDLVRDKVDVIPLPNQKFKGLNQKVTIYQVTQATS